MWLKKLLWIGITLSLLAACQTRGQAETPAPIVPAATRPPQPTPTATSLEPASSEPFKPGAVGMGSAYVDSVELLLMESFPVQVAAIVRGNFPDGCTTLEQATAVREENTFYIQIVSRRPAGAMCTDVLTPFEVSLPLEVAGLKAGEYRVVAGEQSASFTLAQDNVLAP